MIAPQTIGFPLSTALTHQQGQVLPSRAYGIFCTMTKFKAMTEEKKEIKLKYLNFI